MSEDMWEQVCTNTIGEKIEILEKQQSEIIIYVEEIEKRLSGMPKNENSNQLEQPNGYEGRLESALDKSGTILSMLNNILSRF